MLLQLFNNIFDVVDKYDPYGIFLDYAYGEDAYNNIKSFLEGK